MRRLLPFLAAATVLLAGVILQEGCKRPSERRKERARLDSLRADTARPVFNPYKLGQGNAPYNRERENLGNIDSLVTPAAPHAPATATNPRP